MGDEYADVELFDLVLEGLCVCCGDSEVRRATSDFGLVSTV